MKPDAESFGGSLDSFTSWQDAGATKGETTMLVRDRIKWLRERVAEQRAWINKCGGDLTGYIEHYGDPDRAPLDRHGNCQTFTLTAEQAALFDEGYLRPVPNAQGSYYAPMFGSGGTAIYEADASRLASWERELAEWELRCPAAANDPRPSQEESIRKLLAASEKALRSIRQFNVAHPAMSDSEATSRACVIADLVHAIGFAREGR